jgi:hypothetical protein
MQNNEQNNQKRISRQQVAATNNPSQRSAASLPQRLEDNAIELSTDQKISHGFPRIKRT